MTPKKIPFHYNINRMCAVDLVSIIHIDDCDTRFIELHLTDEGEPFAVDGSTVTARFVTVREKYLLSDNVPCAADGNTITIPIDAAAVQSMACDIKIEVNIVNGDKILTLPFPLWIRVRGSILDSAEITPESKGTIPELLEEVKEELERVEGYVDEARVEEIIDSKGYITANIPNNKLVAGDGDGGIKAAPYFVTDYSDDIDAAIPAGLPTCKAVHDSVDAAKSAAISEAAKYVAEAVQTGSGISGELVSADGVGTLKRSGYEVSNSESSIQDVTTKEHTIPTARAVAKVINAAKAKIPSKTSQLQNDSGFLTSHQDISGKADKATTLAGYGIANAYTKEEADEAFAGSAAVSKNRAELTGGAMVPEMERGSIRNNPTDYVTTQSYIRTKQGFSVWLNPGAVIGMSDYTNAQFFVWLTRPDGTFAKSAVMTGDYIVKEFGFYQLVASHNPVAALTDAEVAALIASIHIQNTAAVAEQGASALAPILIGRNQYDNPYIDFTIDAAKSTAIMTIPRNSSILTPSGYIGLGAAKLNINCVVSGVDSVKIVYDKTDGIVKAVPWNSADSNNVLIANVSYYFNTSYVHYKLPATVSINAPYRINNRCLGLPFSEVLTPIAIGYDSNQRRNYVEVNTVNKTITFPASTLIFAGEANGFVSLNDGKQLVVDYSGIPLAGSAYYGVIKLYFNTVTKQIVISPRNSIQYGMYPLVAIMRVPQTTTDTTLPSIAINAPAVIDNHFGGFIDQTLPKNGLIRQISHRGYNTQAPENTLPAFRLAKIMGFDTVETDVQRTADGKYICIHDGSINDRVAQNAGDLTIPVNIADITLEQAQQYDVGRVKGAVSEKYQGTRIPTLEEALQLCRAIGLKMYIELKSETLFDGVSASDREAYVQEILTIIKTNGMINNVAMVSLQPQLLAYVKSACPALTLIYGVDGAATASVIHNAAILKNSTNEVVISLNIANCQTNSENIDSVVASCAANNIQMGAWFANYDGSNYILNAHPYVSEFTCNSLLPGNILYDNSIN